MSDEQGSTGIRRDRGGRFEQGVSANPAGRPRGIMNEATRIAAMMLTERAPDLVKTAIDMAVVGKDVPLKLCLDKIIASQKDQPVAFAMPPVGDGDGLAGAVAALWNAVAEGLVTPSQAASLSQALEAQTRAIEARERSEARRAAAAAPAIYNRMQLRCCIAIADGVREIRDEAGEVDQRARDLCTPILRIGEMALAALAAIPDRLELVLADRAFVADHPVPSEHPPHPFAAEMSRPLQALNKYLNDNMHRLEDQIEERFAAREAAGEPDPIYRSWVFRPAEGLFNSNAKST
ncbi:MAG TPA: hypothetical protein VEK82_12100 [Stellaceae bacterium]|nr:hypothetical protein [Stellaceae bacterium]